MAKTYIHQYQPAADVETVRIPLLGSPGNRSVSTAKDQRFVNGYFWEIKNPITGKAVYHFVKRPGLAQSSRPPAANAVGRGIYSWEGSLYSVFGNKMYKDGVDLGTTMDTTTGLCGFAETRPGASTQYLGINDGEDLYLISTVGVVSKISGPTTFPSPNTGELLYADGYWFVLKQATVGLYNCNLDDPTTWDPTKFITPQMYNKEGVGLARQNNLILVFTENAFQAFYDNANATGSPFSNYESAAQQVGCIGTDTIVHDEGDVFWVGSSFTGGNTVWMLSGITDTKEIATDQIRLLLGAEGANLTSAYATLVRTSGKKLYILTLPTTGKTLVYDTMLQIWTEFEEAGGSAEWPVVDFAQHLQTLYAQHPTNGRIYTLGPSTYQDDSTNFTVLARFGRLDIDTMRRKFVKSYELIGDKQASTTNVDFQYSDDDYNTYSTARVFDMSQTRPLLTRGGSFRRRAHQLSYAGNNPLRIEALEMRYRLGDN